MLPWPNRISLAVRFCSWMVTAVPPEDRMEPEPETEVTPPMVGVVVATILPVASTVRKVLARLR